jgi:glutamine synthetase
MLTRTAASTHFPAMTCLQDAAQHLTAHEIAWVECAVPEFTSVARGKVLNSALFVSEGGCKIPAIIFGLALHGFEAPEIYKEHFPETLGDATAVPDWHTMVADPLSPRAMATVLCDVRGEVAAPDGAPFDVADVAPRMLLKRQIARLAQAGYTAMVAPELEMFLVHKGADGTLRAAGGVSGRIAHDEPSLDMMSLELASSMAPYFDALFAACEAQRIPVTGYAHEAAWGQYEVNFSPAPPLAQADAVFRFKRLARELARRHGFHATFLPKPFAKELGCGMHWHISLLDGEGRNAFTQADGAAHERFMHFIGGLQAGAPGAMALYAPYPASFERVANPYASPASAAWGFDNRTVAFRVPESSPVNRRVECRLPGGDSNPYLIVASMIGAGLAGMQQRIAPSEPALDASPAAAALQLPRTQIEALRALDQNALLTEVFGRRFVRLYCAHKRFEAAECTGPDWTIEHLLTRA